MHSACNHSIDRRNHNARKPITFSSIASAVPPHVWFGVSAVFHYLGPAFAVLLFPHVGVLGVAWLRIASAALIFAPVTRPWRPSPAPMADTRLLLIAFGACLAAMNCSFYLALDRLPISLVAAIEFVGTIGVALFGLRSRRNLAALAVCRRRHLAADRRANGRAIRSACAWAFLNGALFVGYIVLGHRLARAGASDGVANLGAAMAIAMPVRAAVRLHAMRSPPSPRRCFLRPPSASASARRSFPISATSWRCRACRAPASRCCSRCCRSPRRSSASSSWRRYPDPTDILGIALVVLGVAIHKPAPETAH